MSAMEKTPSESLPEPVSSQPPPRPSVFTKTALLALVVFGLLAKGTHILCRHRSPASHDLFDASADVCPQVSELVPQRNHVLWETLGSIYSSESFKTKAVDWLSKAVQIPTESYDYFGPVGTDPRWEKFQAFHGYLLDAFPLVHSTLDLLKVNAYGLIFVWRGSNDALKPLLLAAHQDVVPVEPTTIHQWIHPPFSGHFDGVSVWGRGSIDDKSGLIGIMSAIETMIANGHEPTRTVVLAFGFDEESSGIHGAQNLAIKLQEMFGENGYAMLVDEGAGYGNQLGRFIASPGVAEKGYVDVRIQVTTPGGHSSMPPPHTSIGILSQLLVRIEENPFKAELARDSPMYQNIQCLARHTPGLPERLRNDILKSLHSDKALRAVERALFKDSDFENLIRTTQAIDMVQGGVKVNALPEQAWAVVNHRISTESTVDETKLRDIQTLKALAGDFNLSYTAFGQDIGDPNAPAYGTLTLSEAFGKEGLEPAPVTPTKGDAVPYQLLSGTIKATFNSHRGIRGDDTIVVSPGIMSGNTDTKFYWKLTPHIFRYGHNAQAGGKLPPGIHTINEAMPVDNFVETIRFFTTLILNADESSLL